MLLSWQPTFLEASVSTKGMRTFSFFLVSKHICNHIFIFTVSSERFSVAMTILNLVIRPVTSVVLWRIGTERGGAEFPGRNTFGDIFGTIICIFSILP